MKENTMRHMRIARPAGIGIVGVVCLMLIAVTACGSHPGANSAVPIKIGASLSLTGDFAADGLACEQGYQLWAEEVNAHGGLLGRKVVLDILPDDSSVEQVTANYQKLITQDHVDLLFGPFSTLLTKPASVVANDHGYALVEGSGGGPSVFNRGLHNIFGVSMPAADSLVSFTKWVLSLPATRRPTTAVYVTSDDPFTQPQVDLANHLLTQGGIAAAIPEIVYPSETTDFASIAQRVIAAKADVVVLGTVSLESVAFIKAFEQQHYTPKVIIATAGPDQGTPFVQAIGGTAAAEGIMVPNSWFAEEGTPGNTEMVQAYLAKYGGTPDAISADVPEAYSVGQVVQQAVTKIGSLNQAKLMQELHSDAFTTVQGPVTFDSTGQNIAIQAYLFQWQHGALKPIFPTDTTGSAPPEYPKAIWP
jgi:branched-chain amino acid transport system substrate-binding protein